MSYCALFDIDGTLIRTGGAGSLALRRACAELHTWPADEDAVAGVSMAGNTDPRIVDEIFQYRVGRAPTQAEREALIERYLAHLPGALEDAGGFRVLPGVDAAIATCEAHGAAVGLATGNVELGARTKLERAKLWHRFRFGGYGCDAAERHLLVARARERGEAHAGRRFADTHVLVIGDTPRDVAAARAIGAVAVAVATGGSTRADLADCRPDVLLDTLEELPDWLARLT